MTSEERAEIEDLAEQAVKEIRENVCPHTARRDCGKPVPCDRGKHDGKLHWNDAMGFTWSGP